ncbi:MAG TPA: tRNA (N6-isopentenyl adenosine(37)-C2)-methylthiotransferase MiaB [candidate division Zixibacteria bacterium]|nr:tRNA (N6-isopentenyl adenosine(37)-C2)-methylthiotransferase MiaB [candidate division Zixibacteria bacterium]
MQKLPPQDSKLAVYIETYGCQMNEYDSELVRAILLENGFREVGDAAAADVVLLNTCAVRENAHNRVFGRLQMLEHLYKDKELTVGVLGCMAQNLKLELLANDLHVDLIAGPDSYRSLPRLIREARDSGKQASSIDLSEFETYDDIYPARKDGVNAWIAVMRGCDNFCTFCVVPYTRGRERSRPLESVVDETKKLVSEGYSQVTLLGQNVNSYKHDGKSFADLMRAVADVPGIKRVRFTSPHPKDFPDDLLDAIASHPHICKHIHLPLQAGSDRILGLMRRLHTSDEYLKLVDHIRQMIPDISLTTDIILGFPTETREEFEQTVQLVEKVRFDSAFIFNYSERKGTVAGRRWPDDISSEEKKYRITLLNDIQNKINRSQNQRHIGQVFDLLVEGPSRRSSSQWSGRNDYGHNVIFPHKNEKPGDYIQVKILSATAVTLKGERA